MNDTLTEITASHVARNLSKFGTLAAYCEFWGVFYTCPSCGLNFAAYVEGNADYLECDECHANKQHAY